MTNRRRFIMSLGVISITALAGCTGGGGNGNGNSDGDNGTSGDLPGNTLVESEPADILSVDHSGRFEEGGEFSQVLVVEGTVENMSEDSTVEVTIGVELSRYLNTEQTMVEVTPGGSATFTIRFPNVDSERVDEYDLVVSYTSPPT